MSKKRMDHFSNQYLIQLSNYPTIQPKIQLPQNKNAKNSSSKTQILAGWLDSWISKPYMR